MPEEQVLMDRNDIKRCLNRLVHEIVENNPDFSDMVIVGIKTRGAVLAQRIAKKLKTMEGVELPVGAVDITFNRDDLHMNLNQPVVRQTEIDFDITNKTVLLVDDVLFTGRTIQAALETLKDFGRPKAVRLTIFINRGHRELPIHADYIGKEIKAQKQQSIRLHLKETDKTDKVVLVKQ